MLLEIKQFLQHAMPYLPFISAAVVSQKELNVSAFISRVIETAIIGGIIMYANVQVLDSKFKALEKTITKVETSDEKVRLRVLENERNMSKILLEIRGLSKDLEHHSDHSRK